jgi:hypothetical protein
MKTRNMETITGSHPMEKGVKEKGLITPPPSFLYLQSYEHFFLSKCTASSIVESFCRVLHSVDLRNFPLQQAKLTRRGMTQAKLKNPKIEFNKALANSQWSKRWSMVSPLFLHKQYQSITTLCCFLKLPKVRILPKVVIQAKIATLK